MEGIKKKKDMSFKELLRTAESDPTQPEGPVFSTLLDEELKKREAMSFKGLNQSEGSVFSTLLAEELDRRPRAVGDTSLSNFNTLHEGAAKKHIEGVEQKYNEQKTLEEMNQIGAALEELTYENPNQPEEEGEEGGEVIETGEDQQPPGRFKNLDALPEKAKDEEAPNEEEKEPLQQESQNDCMTQDHIRANYDTAIQAFITNTLKSRALDTQEYGSLSQFSQWFYGISNTWIVMLLGGIFMGGATMITVGLINDITALTIFGALILVVCGVLCFFRFFYDHYLKYIIVSAYLEGGQRNIVNWESKLADNNKYVIFTKDVCSVEEHSFIMFKLSKITNEGNFSVTHKLTVKKEDLQITSRVEEDSLYANNGIKIIE
jgi:hypothetical protein